jgi:patatin-like phospholipase/acyl hydrolase
MSAVLGSLRQLIPQALNWIRVSSTGGAQNILAAGDINILSLDGGGVKGLFSIIVLETLMEAVRQIVAPNVPDALKPCNYFDLICGTSTGGLLAIMLG